jgi:multisubunit Na+/H+ antiporter MnhB subunit
MKAHRTDVLSLIFGLLFLAVAIGFTTQELLNIKLPDFGWFLAGGGVLIGLAIAITALVPHRDESKASAEDPKDPEQV